MQALQARCTLRFSAVHRAPVLNSSIPSRPTYDRGVTNRSSDQGQFACLREAACSQLVQVYSDRDIRPVELLFIMVLGGTSILGLERSFQNDYLVVPDSGSRQEPNDWMSSKKANDNPEDESDHP